MTYRSRRQRTPYFVHHILKLCLNLIVLASFGFLIKHGCDLFSQPPDSQTQAIIGSAILIGGIIAMVMLIKLSKRAFYETVQPSMKLTILSVVVVIIILGLAGVQPIAGYMAEAIFTVSLLTQWTALIMLLNPLSAIIAVACIVWIVITIRDQ